MELFVESVGEGFPVVLLHGAPTTPWHMRPLAERLARRWRTLLVHLPGYGKSPPLSPYELEESLTAVEETLLRRGVAEAMFVGHSGGAYRAFAHATRGRVRARAIAGIGATADFPEEEAGGLLESAKLLRRDDPVEPVLDALMLTPASRANEVWRADVMAWGTATPRAHLAEELEALARAPNLLPALAALDVPILLRVGELDAATPPARSRRIAAVAKRVTLEVVEDAGHAILCEDLDATSASIEHHFRAAIAE